MFWWGWDFSEGLEEERMKGFTLKCLASSVLPIVAAISLMALMPMMPFRARLDCRASQPAKSSVETSFHQYVLFSATQA